MREKIVDFGLLHRIKFCLINVSVLSNFEVYPQNSLGKRSLGCKKLNKISIFNLIYK